MSTCPVREFRRCLNGAKHTLFVPENLFAQVRDIAEYWGEYRYIGNNMVAISTIGARKLLDIAERRLVERLAQLVKS